MKRDLTPEEIEQLLVDSNYGHLGCIDGKEPYVVPITYVYDDDVIYSFAFEGRKIDVMRKNPHVCVQVDHVMPDTEQWKSAIAWGTFVELTKQDEIDEALDMLISRLYEEGVHKHNVFMPFRNSVETMERAIDEDDTVLYRINVSKKTGRYEQYE